MQRKEISNKESPVEKKPVNKEDVAGYGKEEAKQIASNEYIDLSFEEPMPSSPAGEFVDDEAYDVKPPLQRIVTKMMSSKSVSEIDDNAIFLIGFARKDIVGALGIQLKHSAVAFFDTSTEGPEKWLILGRQTPGFLKSEVKESKQQRGGLFHNYTSSTIDNEKNYNFFRSNKFESEMTEVRLTGKEVKEITEETDAMICQNKMFNLIISNCYSASVTMLANAIKVIDKRPEESIKDRDTNNASILKIYQLILGAKDDNLGLGIGVATVGSVRGILAEVEAIMDKRRIHPSYLERKSSDENSSVKQGYVASYR